MEIVFLMEAANEISIGTACKLQTGKRFEHRLEMVILLECVTETKRSGENVENFWSPGL